MKKHLVFLFLLSLSVLLPAAPCQARTHIPGTGRVGGPGTTTPQYIMDLESASAILRKLDSDSRVLYTDQDALITRVDNIHDFLDTSAKRLALLTTIDEDLKKLEAALRAVDSSAEAAEVIPQARQKAKKLRASVSASLTNVTAARQRMDAVVAKTEPIRRKMESAADKADKLSTGLEVVNDGPIANMRFPIAIASGCLKKMPGPTRACASPKVDDVAGKADTVVLEYDRVVKALLYKPEPWLPSMKFFDPITVELNNLEKLRAEIEKILSEANKLTAGLKGLNKVLDRDFSFSFPYPDPTLTNPVRFSNYDVSIGFRTIIKGANAIQEEIESKLTKPLLTVLNGLGMKKYIDIVVDKANDAADAALKAVHFDVNLGLPSLNALNAFEASLPGLTADVDALKLPEFDPKLPGFGFPGVQTGINFGDVGDAYKFFSPNGIDIRSLTLCNGVSYGCN